MKKSEVRQIIKEEIKGLTSQQYQDMLDGKLAVDPPRGLQIRGLQISEGLHSMLKDMDKGMEELIDAIKRGDKGVVDPRAMQGHSDGEILGMFLAPFLQGWAMKLKDPEGFRKHIKKKL